MISTPRRDASDSGFVLIGVIIFVLALTIIGISLFSLSSYEAQFLQDSLDGEQAFQSAVGGIERAKFLLCSDSRLDSIGVTLPGVENVVTASAVQYLAYGDSVTTVVHWDSTTTIRLRVTASVRDQQRSVEARFVPRQVDNYYRQLIAVGGGIDVDILASTGQLWERNRAGTVHLSGTIWDSEPGYPQWLHRLGLPQPTHVQHNPDVPTPGVQDFMASLPILPSPTPAFPYAYPQEHTVVYTLDSAPGQIGFWRTDGDHPDWSLYVGYVTTPNGSSDPRANVTEVSVGGLAVWVFPRGVLFEHQVRVRPRHAGQNCLAIVAGDHGICFNGGIQADVPVILVSSGEVAIRHQNEAWGGSVDSYAGELSVFARSVSLMGPTFTYWDEDTHSWRFNTMRLDHPTDGTLDSDVLPALMRSGALPNSSASTGHSLDLISGTWRTSAP